MRDRFTEYMLRSEAPPPRADCCTPITEGPNGATINGFTLPRKKEAYCIDLLFIRRMWHFTKILLKKPSRVGWLYLIMTIFCCLNEVIVYYVGTIPSRYFKVLGDRDRASFWRLLLTSLGTVFLAGFVSCLGDPVWCIHLFPPSRRRLGHPLLSSFCELICTDPSGGEACSCLSNLPPSTCMHVFIHSTTLISLV